MAITLIQKDPLLPSHITTTNFVIWLVLNRFSITEHKFYAKLNDVLKVTEEYQKDSMHSVPVYKIV